MNRQQLAEDCGQRLHHPQSRRHSQHSTGKPQPQCLQQKDPQQVRRPRAHGFQNRQHVHALLKMSVHCHRHPNRSQHHRHQADQAQDRSRIVQPLAQRGITLTEVHHLRVRQRILEMLAHGHRIDRCRSPARNPRPAVFG